MHDENNYYQIIHKNKIANQREQNGTKMKLERNKISDIEQIDYCVVTRYFAAIL